MSSVDEELKSRMRAFLGANALPMRGAKSRSVYGVIDYRAHFHMWEDKCRFVIPEGTVVREVIRSEFMGTFVDNEDSVGLEIDDGIFCACGVVGTRWANTSPPANSTPVV